MLACFSKTNSPAFNISGSLGEKVGPGSSFQRVLPGPTASQAISLLRSDSSLDLLSSSRIFSCNSRSIGTVINVHFHFLLLMWNQQLWHSGRTKAFKPVGIGLTLVLSFLFFLSSQCLKHLEYINDKLPVHQGLSSKNTRKGWGSCSWFLTKMKGRVFAASLCQVDGQNGESGHKNTPWKNNHELKNSQETILSKPTKQKEWEVKNSQLQMLLLVTDIKLLRSSLFKIKYFWSRSTYLSSRISAAI